MLLTGFAFRVCRLSNIPGVPYPGRQLPMVQVPEHDSVEQTHSHEFLDSSMRLFTALDSRFVAAHGLILTEVRLLSLLARSNTGAVPNTELRRALALTPRRLTQIFRRLQLRGLVAQETTHDDRRGVLLRITALGRARVEVARKTLAHEVRTHNLNRIPHSVASAPINQAP
jgi:DNA-binding MarR family transcriptional regulator